MADTQMNEISVYINNLKERFRFPPLNFRLSGGTTILSAVVVLIIIIFHNLFFVYV